LAEYQQEFTAYVAFADKLSRYYTVHPNEFEGPISTGRTIGQEVMLSVLLHKADDYRETRYYLGAISYYAEVKRAFSGSEDAPYSIYRIAECYIAQDLPDHAEAEACYLEQQYPSSPWGLELLRSKADLLLTQYQRVAAAEIWLRVSELSQNIEEKTRTAILASQILSEEKQPERAAAILRKVLSEHKSFAYRDYAEQVLGYILKKDLGRIAGGADDVLGI
jgi:tetratricopeptide (TPR) repeat protein